MEDDLLTGTIEESKDPYKVEIFLILVNKQTTDTNSSEDTLDGTEEPIPLGRENSGSSQSSWGSSGNDKRRSFAGLLGIWDRKSKQLPNSFNPYNSTVEV